MIGAMLALVAASWTVEVWIDIPPTPEALAAAATDRDEVVVNGVRRRRAEMRVRTDRKTGAASCSLKRASGNPGLDAALCEAALSCNVAPIRRKTLEACMMPAIDAVIRTRYPDRTIGPDIPRDRTR